MICSHARPSGPVPPSPSVAEMRRPKIEPWEAEARDATERLRQALLGLATQEKRSAQEQASDPAPTASEPLLEALDAADRTKGDVDRWWREWLVQTAGLKTSRSVALSVYRSCLPPLASALDIYSQSLAILALSPDREDGDGALARQGVAIAKQVAEFTLQLLDETPGIRPVDRAAVDATLAVLEKQSHVLAALDEPIGDRARQLRSERYGA